jgi:acyl phosphate:glycerol-3-phosphate acyltransferase
MELAVFCAAAYLIGSINFSLVLTRLLGRGDLRNYGSGNPGTTNAYRALGKWWALLILFLDVGRGIAVALVAGEWFGTPWPFLLGCLAVVAGNLFPVFHGFRGGKGFAITIGLYLGIDPIVALLALGFWVLLVWLFRMASVGTLSAAVAFPLLLLVREAEVPSIFLGLVLLAVIALTHRDNIRRLLRGTEHRLGRSSR